MNIGRLVVGACAALALVASGAFVHVVFAQTSTPSYGGYTACMSSKSGKSYFFGVGEIYNEGHQDIEVLSVVSRTQRGLDVVDLTVALSGGIGILDATPAVAAEYALTPVAGTIIAPGKIVDVIARLKPVDATGFATDFEITYKNGYGIRHVALLTNVVGFRAPDDDGDADDDFEENCGG
jgi:hypothetical protein